MAGRKPTTVASQPLPEINPVALEQDNQALATFNKLQDGYSDERDLVNQLLGQAQMAGAFEEFSRTVRTSKLAYVKENKLYRVLNGKKNPNGSEYSGTWSEFCSLLGISVDKADMDIANLSVFGETALESMSRMGIGYRELRQFRKLPEDQKTALIEVAQTGDKDSFLELAEELIAKHAKEKEAAQAKLDAAQKQLADAHATLEAKDQLLTTRNKKLDELTVELKKRDTRTPEETEAQRQRLERELLDKLQNTSTKLMFEIQGFAQSVADCLERAEPESSMQSAVVSTVQFLFQRIDEIAKANQIPVDFAEVVVPSWMRAAMAPLETAES
jgi:hypothetical protein